MIPDSVALGLHDQVTRGNPLSPEEKNQLQEWYGRHDDEERASLAQAAAPDMAQVRAQLDAALVQLGVITQRIQSLSAENDALRQEITILRRQLTERLMAQPA